jgi:CHAT domain-containing protein
MGTEAALRLPGIEEHERESVQALAARIGALQNVLQSYSGRQVMGEDAERYAQAALDIGTLEQELAALDAAIAVRVPRYAGLRSPKPVDAGRAQEWCGADTAVLEYALWDDSIDFQPLKIGISNTNMDKRPPINYYCLVLTKDGVSPVALDHGFNYLEAVNSLRNKLITDEGATRGITVVTNTARNAPYEEESNALYNALIKPVLPHIPASVKNIVIVPDGTLAHLPFDILRESKDSPGLGQTYRLSLSPSVSVSVMAAKTGLQNEPLLALGGAWYDRAKAAADRGERGIEYTGLQQNSQPRWLDLPGTETEVKGLQRLASSGAQPTILLGSDVSERKIKDLSDQGQLGAYPIVHFACHGYFNEQESEKSGIVLSEVSGLIDTGEDGYLTIPEIAVLSLNARMVLLSACETGLGQVKRGDGMVGMTRSFLVAGAENVGVSLWSISDEATVEFMTRLYTKVLKQGTAFKEAYYQVKNEFRTHEKWSHPLYWAAFTIYE